MNESSAVVSDAKLPAPDAMLGKTPKPPTPCQTPPPSGHPPTCRQHTLTTLIWLVVRVPVLSEQMTVVQPRVSTLGRVLGGRGGWEEMGGRGMSRFQPRPSRLTMDGEATPPPHTHTNIQCSSACRCTPKPLWSKRTLLADGCIKLHQHPPYHLIYNDPHPYLTIAFCCAIFLVPSARQVVTTAGRPSGMAATAKATAIWGHP